MLIKCPECKREISDKSKQCIHCGYPIIEDLNIENIMVHKLYDIILKDGNVNKIKAIKIVREITGLGLTEAKHLVDTSNSKIVSSIPLDVANKYQQMFENDGMMVEIVESLNIKHSNTNNLDDKFEECPCCKTKRQHIIKDNIKEVCSVCGYVFNKKYVEQHQHLLPQVQLPQCPKCGCTNIQIVPRKWSMLGGFATQKTDRVCVNCKHRW